MSSSEEQHAKLPTASSGVTAAAAAEGVAENPATMTTTTIPKPRRECHCRNSKCLKLYCECFGSGEYCNPSCFCTNCHNNPEHQEERLKAVSNKLENNPYAFQSKIATNQLAEDDDEPVVKHSKGCNCRRSNCLKKYCECFQAGVRCTSQCNCINCRNTGPDPVPLNEYEISGSDPSLSPSKTSKFFSSPNKTPRLSKGGRGDKNLLHSKDSIEKSAFSFVLKNVDPSLACEMLILTAREAEKRHEANRNSKSNNNSGGSSTSASQPSSSSSASSSTTSSSITYSFSSSTSTSTPSHTNAQPSTTTITTPSASNMELDEHSSPIIEKLKCTESEDSLDRKSVV